MELIKFPGSDFANQLELCNVNQNPMFGNASVLFPTLWRFLPVIDDQVRDKKTLTKFPKNPKKLLKNISIFFGRKTKNYSTLTILSTIKA